MFCNYELTRKVEAYYCSKFLNFTSLFKVDACLLGNSSFPNCQSKNKLIRKLSPYSFRFTTTMIVQRKKQKVALKVWLGKKNGNLQRFAFVYPLVKSNLINLHSYWFRCEVDRVQVVCSVRKTFKIFRPEHAHLIFLIYLWVLCFSWDITHKLINANRFTSASGAHTHPNFV